MLYLQYVLRLLVFSTCLLLCACGDGSSDSPVSDTSILDIIAPVVTLNGNSEIILFQNKDYTEQGATATDDRDGSVEVIISGTVDTSTLGIYTLTYRATDSANNTSSVTRAISVVEAPDTIAPVITLNGNSEITLLLYESYNEQGATATDDRDGSVGVIISGTVDTSTLGIYTLTYRATDSANNTSSVTRAISVVEAPDTIAPVITLNGNSEITLLLDESYNEQGATATDDRDGSVDVIISGTVNTSTLGNYTLTYSATDSADNTSSATRAISLVEAPDTTAPVITLNGNNEITLFKNEDYTEQGATAIDGRDGSVEVIISGTVDTSTLGNYTLAYSATDSADNTSSVTRTISVIVDPSFFITTWITNPSGLGYITGENQIMISTQGSGYDYQVKWGDGSFDEHVSDDIIHTYAISGTYTVTITGHFPQIIFEDIWDYDPNDGSPYPNPSTDNAKLLSIEQWGNIKWRSMYRAFKDCYNLIYNATDPPDLSDVKDMEQMFANNFYNPGDVSFNQGISNWDVSNVTNMDAMFWGADAFNQNLNSWDVSNVTDMDTMFRDANAFNQDISGWNVLNVTSMVSMFWDAKAFNQDISGWNVSNVTNMAYMFRDANAFNQDISGWNVSNVTSMASMFWDAKAFNQDISGWNVSNVTNMDSMFLDADSFNKDLSNWDVSSVTSMALMFYNTGTFNQDINRWDVSNVINMRFMFASATSFNQNIDSWNVSNVMNMEGMFDGVTLSIVNYDALLSGWSSLPLKNNVSFSAGNSQHSSASQGAKDVLLNSYNWQIIDGGVAN